MKSIVVDIDGVISDYDYPTMMKKHFGQTVTKAQIKTHSLADCLGIRPSMACEMFRKECLAPPNKIPGAIETLRYWMSKDFDIFIFSYRLQFIGEHKLLEWLENWRIPNSGLVTLDTLPSYITAHVDDRPEKLLDVRDRVAVKHSILFQQPWNKLCLNIENVLEPAKNWKEVRSIVNGG